MEEVIEKINDPLDVEHPIVLRKQLAYIEAWRYRITFKLREEQKILAELQSINDLRKERGTTEADRKIHREFKNREQILIVNHLADIVDCIDKRISLGQSFLSGLKEERKRYRDWETDRKSTRLNSSHSAKSRMPSSA